MNTTKALITNRGAVTVHSGNDLVRILNGTALEPTEQDVARFVAWVSRAKEIRAQGVARMPLDIENMSGNVITDETLRDLPPTLAFLRHLPMLLQKWEGSMVKYGRAYTELQRNTTQVAGLQYLRPWTVFPRFRGSDGELIGFDRKLGTREISLDIEDVLYLWPPDEDVELGPAENYPMQAALAAATALYGKDEFLTSHFKRGLIKAAILQYEGPPPGREEAEEIKSWWKNVVSGVKNAWNMFLMSSDYQPLVLGEGLADLDNKDLTDSLREEVSTAFGIPQSKLTANAANFATKNSDDKMFVEDTLAPRCDFIAMVLNEQLMEPLGYRIVFKPERLSVMQEDEEQRSAALVNLTNAGMKLETALDTLGYDIPEDAEIREPVQELPLQLMQQPPAEEEPQPLDVKAQAEGQQFRRWLTKRGAGADPDDFTALHMPPEMKADIYQEHMADQARELHGQFAEALARLEQDEKKYVQEMVAGD